MSYSSNSTNTHIFFNILKFNNNTLHHPAYITLIKHLQGGGGTSFARVARPAGFAGADVRSAGAAAAARVVVALARVVHVAVVVYRCLRCVLLPVLSRFARQASGKA